MKSGKAVCSASGHLYALHCVERRVAAPVAQAVRDGAAAHNGVDEAALQWRC